MMLLAKFGTGVLGWICLGLAYGLFLMSSARSDDALPHDAFDIPPLAILAIMVSMWPYFIAVDLVSIARRFMFWR